MLPWSSAVRPFRRRSSATDSSTTTTTAQGHAVPVLTHPFPVPHASNFIHTSFLPKDPLTGRVGVHFCWNGVGGAVTIQQLSLVADHNNNDNDDALLLSQQPWLQVGQVVLAIDGHPVLAGSRQAAHLVRAAPGPYVELLTTHNNNNHTPPLPCYTRLVAAPRAPHSYQHPGIVLDATRNRCLVQIARVFPHGPWAGRVHAGDLLLAVQNVAVATVAAAERALSSSQAQSQQPYTVLYVVDMQAYRRSIWQELGIWKPFAHVEWVDDDEEDNHDHQRRPHRATRTSLVDNTVKLRFHPKPLHKNKKHKNNQNQNTVVELAIDPVSQRLIPPATSDWPRHQPKRWGNRLGALIAAFNERLEKRLRVLEEAVGHEAWQYQHLQEQSPCHSSLRRGVVVSARSRSSSGCSCHSAAESSRTAEQDTETKTDTASLETTNTTTTSSSTTTTDPDTTVTTTPSTTATTQEEEHEEEEEISLDDQGSNEPSSTAFTPENHEDGNEDDDDNDDFSSSSLLDAASDDDSSWVDPPLSSFSSNPSQQQQQQTVCPCLGRPKPSTNHRPDDGCWLCQDDEDEAGDDNDDDDDDSVEDDSALVVPLAVASSTSDLLGQPVWPWEAMQTLDERNNSNSVAAAS